MHIPLHCEDIPIHISSAAVAMNTFQHIKKQIGNKATIQLVIQITIFSQNRLL